jgi:hypothetical protein
MCSGYGKAYFVNPENSLSVRNLVETISARVAKEKNETSRSTLQLEFFENDAAAVYNSILELGSANQTNS